MSRRWPFAPSPCSENRGSTRPWDRICETLAIGHVWGATRDERELRFACDRFVPRPDSAFYRAVTVNAPAAQLFRWLCQLRVAPYSYDWLDNFGQQSPQTLTAGLELLRTGQRIMTVFRLVAFEPDRHITAALDFGRPLIDELAVTYLIVPEAGGRCRLLVKVVVAYPRNTIGMAMRTLLPAGDLVMMRRQLFTLRNLAERDAAGRAGTAPQRADEGRSWTDLRHR
jgi:hypothetical protein